METSGKAGGKARKTASSAAKLKKLPKDFPQLLQASPFDLEAVKAVFARCAIDARGGYMEETALMMSGCTVELAHWLVAQGADVNAVDKYGNTALHAWSRRVWKTLPVALLLELGCQADARDKEGLTPLHCAADGKNLEAVRTLLAHGVECNAVDQNQHTPLEYALLRASNLDLPRLAPVAEALLQAGATVSSKARDYTRKLATTFDFHRAKLDAALLQAGSSALDTLCGLLSVEKPVPRRLHDGSEAITVNASSWQKQHAELWQLLVPSSGPAKTVQGEVIRISGRIGDELQRNGGCNWDTHYDAMAEALLGHVQTQVALSEEELRELRAAVKSLRREDASNATLARLSVAWVLKNPTPVTLSKPTYNR